MNTSTPTSTQPSSSTSILTSEMVRSIAKLARLYENMDDALVEEYRRELEVILGLADELQQIDTTGIDFLDGARTMTIDQLREDIPDGGEDYERVRQNIINNFPNSQNNLLVIEGIFESD